MSAPADNRLVEFTLWIWHKTSVPVFLEKFILPIFATSVVLLAWSNPMGFDTTQRVTAAATMIFAAYFVGHTVNKNPSKSPAASAVQANSESSITRQQERLAIISRLVEGYQAAHNGEKPTFEWLNGKLKEQGADFRVNPPLPPAGGMMFHGGKFEGNGTAIDNHNPNARFTFDGTDFINNKKGIVNFPAEPSDKTKKPKQP